MDSKNIICTTYFISKNDPQREIQLNSEDLSYINKWCESVNNLKIFGVVFTDSTQILNLGKNEYPFIKFILVKLGDLSLNDERFKIYYRYLQKNTNDINKIILTDGNDVELLKDPFEYMVNFSENEILIGRERINLRLYSQFLLEKIKLAPLGFQELIKNEFYLEPFYNAGIIGGSNKAIKNFLKRMNYYLEVYPSQNNMNMLYFNKVISDQFKLNRYLKIIPAIILNKLPFTIIKKIVKTYQLLSGVSWKEFIDVNHFNDRLGNSPLINTSYPVHNIFKSYQITSSEVFKHK